MVDRGGTTQRLAGALAGVVLVLAASACATPLPSATSSTDASEPSGQSNNPSTATPSAAPSTWPTIAPSAAAVPTRLDLAHIGFWTLEQPMAAVDLSLNPLRVGTLDGRITMAVDLHNPGIGPLYLPLQPQPVGPAGGRVLYVADDGHRAILHVVSVASGADRELMTTTAFIVALAIDPSGTTAYSVTLDRSTGTLVGVEAVATDGGEPHAIISSVDLGPGAATPYTPVSGISYYPQLAVSMDGRWVVLASCLPSGCDVVAVQAGGGPLKHSQAFAFDNGIVGVAGNLLIGSSSPCALGICDGFAIDLRTGDRQPLGGAQSIFDPKQLIAGPHGPLLLGDGGDYAKGEWQVEGLDLTDRTRSSIFAGSFTPAYTVVSLAQSRGASAGAELPPGWFLIYRNANAAPAPYPDFTAATIGGTAEVHLPIMTFPHS